MKEKTEGQKIFEQLSYNKKNVYEEADAARIKDIFDYAEGYKSFLDVAKTEREAAEAAIAMAERAGYRRYRLGDALQVGDCRYFENRGRSVILFRV